MPSWHHQDLTTLAGAPVNSTGDPTSFFNPTSVFDPTNSALHVLYRGSDSHIHELGLQTGVWQDTDLTIAASAPANAAGSPTSFLEPTGPTYQVFYRGSDSHIHELQGNSGVWQHTDLTTASGAPANPVANLASFFDPTSSAYQVFYRGSDSHIHQLQGNSGVWQHTDLTTASGALAVPAGPLIGAPANPVGNLTGFFEPTGSAYHVFYPGTDYHIHELQGRGGVWQHKDPTAAAGARAIPVANLTGFFDPIGPVLHVVYSAGRIYELMWGNGEWRYADLTTLAGALANATGNPTGFSDATGRVEHVFYCGSNSHIHKLQRNPNGVWQHTDPTTAAGAPANATGNPTSFLIRVESVFLSIQYQYVFYRGSDGHIYALWRG
jgi:hypothetical protein